MFSMELLSLLVIVTVISFGKCAELKSDMLSSHEQKQILSQDTLLRALLEDGKRFSSMQCQADLAIVNASVHNGSLWALASKSIYSGCLFNDCKELM